MCVCWKHLSSFSKLNTMHIFACYSIASLLHTNKHEQKKKNQKKQKTKKKKQINQLTTKSNQQSKYKVLILQQNTQPMNTNTNKPWLSTYKSSKPEQVRVHVKSLQGTTEYNKKHNQTIQQQQMEGRTR